MLALVLESQTQNLNQLQNQNQQHKSQVQVILEMMIMAIIIRSLFCNFFLELHFQIDYYTHPYFWHFWGQFLGLNQFRVS